MEEKKKKKVVVNTLDDARDLMEKLVIKLGRDVDYYKFRIDIETDWENFYEEKKDLLDRERRVLGDSHRLLSNIQATLEGNASIMVKKNYLLLFVKARPEREVIKEFPALPAPLEVKKGIEDSFPEPVEIIKRELKIYGYKLRYKCQEDIVEAYSVTKALSKLATK